MGTTGPEEDAVRAAVVAFELRADEVLEQTCDTARRLIGAHQAAITLMVPGDWSRARKYQRAAADAPFDLEPDLVTRIGT